MKGLRILPLSSLLLCLNTQAQNWSLIRLNDSLNFSTDTQTILHTIWVDSLYVQSGDSVFVFNHNLVESMDSIVGAYSYYRLNRPGFLGHEMRKFSDGHVRLTKDLNHLDIFPSGNVGFNWIADSISGITASISGKYPGVVYGLPDSLKVISFSNGKSCTVSKNNGLVLSSDLFGDTLVFVQVGNEFNGKGILTPTFHEIFNYQPGDVFVYRDYSGAHFPGPYSYTRYRVTSVVHTPDSVLCYVDFLRKTYTFMFYNLDDSVFTSGQDTLIFIKSQIYEMNFYPGEIIQAQYGCGSYYKPMQTEFDAVFQALCRTHPYYSWDTINSEIVMEGFNPYLCVNSYKRKWGRGVGLIGESLKVFNYTPYSYVYSNSLLGYMRNGDFLGTVYDSLFFVYHVGEGPTFEAVYPNPANDYVEIKYYDPVSGDCRMYDVSGKLVYNARFIDEKSWRIDFPTLNSGVYFLRANDKTYKVLVQH